MDLRLNPSLSFPPSRAHAATTRALAASALLVYFEYTVLLVDGQSVFVGDRVTVQNVYYFDTGVSNY